MTRRRRTRTAAVGALCATLLALLPLTATTAHAATGDDHTATLTALRTLQRSGGPGAAVHAGDSGGAWTLSVGTGTINTNKPIQSDEHLRIGSQTKTFTAAVVLQLVDEGKVSLDAPIDRYLPGVVTGNGYDGTRITVRHLLRHTGGIAAYDPFASPPRARPDGSYALADLVREGLRRPPVSVPGASFTYSNTGYLVLGMLIEKLTGRPVHDAVTARVIDPLGLSRTVFPAPGARALPAPAVNGYRGTRIGDFFFWTPVGSYDPSLVSSAGAMISTLEDVTAFYQALAAGKVVSPASLAEMEGTGPGYGLGLMKVGLRCGGVAYGHDGGLPGYHTQTLVTPDGRHASAVTNVQFRINAPVAQMYAVLETALCEQQGQARS
ncbi:serine hydrolase [Streptomyces sp. TRM64462]|uniref:serine hydrolase domain-containing protein n=1 Tax=Streptomyces sp. TRM64462 TaxID=2741726 RepID=UPI001586F29E|nr:serine hydrolase domain-containing protein [Streptomyces sp. TRM64462]